MMRWKQSRPAARLAAALLSAGLLTLAVSPRPASAGMPLQAQISGQVSSVQGATAVQINGTTYLIAPNSPASRDIRTVSPGETIGLILNGPAGSATSEVIYITHTTVGGAASARAGR